MNVQPLTASDLYSASTRASLPANIDLHLDQFLHLRPNSTLLDNSVTRATADIWMKATSYFLPKLATPCILGGWVIRFLGVALFMSCFAIKLPFLHILLKNAPLSVMFALLTIRTGIHTTDFGVRMSDLPKRMREDTLKRYRIFALTYLTSKMTKEEIFKELTELECMNSYLPTQMQILRQEKSVRNSLDHPLAILKDELLKPQSDEVKFHEGGWGKWYDFWRNQSFKEGERDIIFGFVLMALSVLSFGGIIQNDLLYSSSFPFILMLNAIACLKIGHQMTYYKRRSAVRVRMNEKLQLIQYCLTHRGEVIENLNPVHELPEKKETPLIQRAKKLCNEYASAITLAAGGALCLFGLAYTFTMWGAQLPSSLQEWVLYKSKITYSFSTAITIAGIHGILRSISLDQKGTKEGWKEGAWEMTEALVSHFTKKKSADKAEGQSLADKPDFPLSQGEAPPTTLQKGLGAAEFGCGIFMLYLGFSMLANALGWNDFLPSPDIVERQSLSYIVVFASTLLFFGGDALNSGYYSYTYKARADADFRDTQRIKALYDEKKSEEKQFNLFMGEECGEC